MRKIVLCGALLCVSYAFAQDLIVYVVPAEIYSASTVVIGQYKQQDVKSDQKKSSLLKQIEQIQTNFAKPNQSQADLDNQSQKLNDLQNNYAELNQQLTQQYAKIKADYMPYIQEATTELYKQNKYQYILNSSSIVMTDPSNDISKDVAKLADKLYQDKQK